MNEERDLSRIRGIGAARARWLEETFGIRTAAELARLAPDDIERQLKAGARIGVSRRAIDSWLKEAGAMAAGSEEPAAATGAAVREEWTSLASFVVDFQQAARDGRDDLRTSVHHLEQDRTESWPGIERDRLCGWMLDQLELTQPEPEEVEPEPSSAEAVSGPTLPVTERLTAEIEINSGGHGRAPIPIQADWSVAFEWSVDMAAGLGAGGEWRLDVLTEPLGHGAPPLRLRGEAVSIPAHPQAETYTESYRVAAGTVTPAHCGMPYRALAVLTYRSPASEHAHPAGFVDLGELFFWHPAQPRPTAQAGAGVPPSFEAGRG